jgi:exonuclease VII small subunit
MKDDMKSDVGDLYAQIAGEESTALGDLLAKIPGLDGYMERGRRRAADQILRETIVGRLEQERLQLSDVHHTLSRDIAMAMDYAEALGRAETRLMGLMGKIKDAPVGYAGFFDAIKVKEENLARIYAFDYEMLGHVDQVAADVDTLQSAVNHGAQIEAAIGQLNSDLALASETFAARTEVIRGIA